MKKSYEFIGFCAEDERHVWMSVEQMMASRHKNHWILDYIETENSRGMIGFHVFTYHLENEDINHFIQSSGSEHFCPDRYWFNEFINESMTTYSINQSDWSDVWAQFRFTEFLSIDLYARVSVIYQEHTLTSKSSHFSECFWKCE